MLPLSLGVSLVLFTTSLPFIRAEQHTIQFLNRCGFGTPTLVQNQTVLSTSSAFTAQGPLISAIAYLQTGGCGLRGEGCTVVETTLTNPTIVNVGPNSSTGISLTPPHAFSVPTGFGYFNGCEGFGEDCTIPNCLASQQNPNGSFPQVVCVAENVDLAITFCD